MQSHLYHCDGIDCKACYSHGTIDPACSTNPCLHSILPMHWHNKQAQWLHQACTSRGQNGISWKSRNSTTKPNLRKVERALVAYFFPCTTTKQHERHEVPISYQKQTSSNSISWPTSPTKIQEKGQTSTLPLQWWRLNVKPTPKRATQQTLHISWRWSPLRGQAANLDIEPYWPRNQVNSHIQPSQLRIIIRKTIKRHCIHQIQETHETTTTIAFTE